MAKCKALTGPAVKGLKCCPSVEGRPPVRVYLVSLYDLDLNPITLLLKLDLDTMKNTHTPKMKFVAPSWPSNKAGSRLSLLSARPAVTFPAEEHCCLLASTKLYCLVIDAHRCN